MTSRRPTFLVLFALVASACVVRAAHPVVPSFERFHAAKPSAEGGLLLLGELNCTSCHTASEELAAHVVRKQAPVLDEVGSRVKPAWMKRFIADPQGTKPGTTMPSLLAAVPAEEREEVAEALVQFLATTGTAVDTPIDRKLLGDGRRLFHEVGCTACHAPVDGVAPGLATTVPLPEKFEEKYTVQSLERFLANPHAVRPSGRMPGQKWEKDEAKKVAHYLMRDLSGVDPVGRKDRPKIPYAYYEGNWQTLPDLDKLKPTATGVDAAYDIGLRRRNDNFALAWDAVFEAPRDGRYTFSVASDDGSKLWVDGKVVVTNDGIHPHSEKSGGVDLQKGIHRVRVAMFEAAGDESVAAFVAGPGLPRQHLANVVAADEEALRKGKVDEPKPDPADPDVFVFDEAKAARGRELFASLGCANCHQLKGVKSTLAAKPLASLPGLGVCLAPEPTKDRPFYSLSDAQRASLRDAIEAAAKPLPELALADRIHATMTRFNCYTCHVRGEVGGVEEARDPLFQITQKEMGDEGRLPPPLNGVGAKLTQNWLRQTLDKGANDRPYMKVRMPAFGNANVGHLVADLEKADPLLDEVDIPEIDEPLARIKATGRHMTGDKVFGCIKCHNFNGKQGTGVQSIDLTILTKRLKHDWFHAYMRNPQKYRPGTRMPAAWPLGQSTVPDILDGTAGQQIEGIWIYLSDGGGAKTPLGIDRNPIVLAADEEPRVYRNFIQGAGPRAIGVAYPAGANIAWDANELSLALVWQGQFIDASKHWIGRGPGYQDPLGDLVVPLERRVPVARVESPGAAWPGESAKERGYRFRGYRYNEKREPIFRYEFDDVLVEDFVEGVRGETYPSLRRTISVSSKGVSPKVENVVFRAAVADEITETDDGWFHVGKNVRMKLSGKPFVVDWGGKKELRVPLSEREPIVQEIRW